MIDPDRLLDQPGSPLERALLQEARSYHGPKDLRDHTLAALGVAAPAGLAMASLAWLSTRTWGTKLLLTVSTASILAAIPVGYFALRPGSPPPASLTTHAVITPPPEPSLVPPPAEVEPPSTLPAMNAPAHATTTLPARASRRSGSTGADLRAELAALDAVRTTLASGDAVRALALLDTYFRTFHRGRLHLEAEVLRMDALAKDGRTDAARTYAKEFLARHPNSVLAARVQSFAGR